MGFHDLACYKAVYSGLDHSDQCHGERGDDDQNNVAEGDAVLHVEQQVRNAELLHRQRLIETHRVPREQFFRLAGHTDLLSGDRVLVVIPEQRAGQQRHGDPGLLQESEHGTVSVAVPVVLQLNVTHHEPCRAKSVLQLVFRVRNVLRDRGWFLVVVFQNIVYGFLGDQPLVLHPFRVPFVHDDAGHAEKGVFQNVLIAFFSLFDLFTEPAHFFHLPYSDVTSSV